MWWLLLALAFWYWYSRGVKCQAGCDLTGRVAIVTGGASGIGKEVAIGIAKRNCQVVIADVADGSAAVSEIRAKSGNSSVAYLQIDLGLRQSIEKFVLTFSEQYSRLDILINNAGLVCTNDDKAKTRDGHEIHFGVHFLGPYYLTHLLWGTLSKSDRMRVVNTSSIAHYCVWKFDLKVLQRKRKGQWDQFMAYSFSKLLVNHMTKALARKAESIPGGRVVSVHPGFVRTPLISKLGWIDTMLKPIALVFFVDSRMGAQTTLHCVLSESDALSNGKYYAGCKLSRSSDFSNDERLVSKSIRLAQAELMLSR